MLRHNQPFEQPASKRAFACFFAAADPGRLTALGDGVPGDNGGTTHKPEDYMRSKQPDALPAGLFFVYRGAFRAGAPLNAGVRPRLEKEVMQPVDNGFAWVGAIRFLALRL